MANGNSASILDGQIDWSGGVNSAKVKTIASEVYPDGLARNQLPWLVNGTVRGGGILQRTGWQPQVKGAPWSGLFQGAYMYEPPFADPYIVLLVGGRVYRARVDTDNSVEDMSAFGAGLTMPPTEPQAYFAQADQFLVIQSGDEVTNPLFWCDRGVGSPLTQFRRSAGFIAPGNSGNEIPPAGPMDYHMNRLWYAFRSRGYVAGDIILNKTSGSIGYSFTDSVLKVTENPVAYGGDSFLTPAWAGSIRALKHASTLDTALGESPLFVLTRRAIFTCEAPITRDDWAGATLNKLPLQRVALDKGGTYAERSVVAVNGDLFFTSLPNGDIRSLRVSVRNDHQWGNVPLSRNENRALQFNDRSLLRLTSGIQFNNRLWQTCLPEMTPAGVGCAGVLPLDFDVISTLEERNPPAWEGIYEGLKILQLVEGDFGGRERGFAIVWSELDEEIQIWELTLADRFQNGENRVTWEIEFPAYTGGNPFQLKELETVELWIDKMLGTVDFEAFWRPDQHPCWFHWHAWKDCAAKDCRESMTDPCIYPGQPFCEQFRATKTLPKPPVFCQTGGQRRPAHWGYQFQVRLVIKGWCRIRGLLMHMLRRDKAQFEGLVCQTITNGQPKVAPPIRQQGVILQENFNPILQEGGSAEGGGDILLE